MGVLEPNQSRIHGLLYLISSFRCFSGGGGGGDETGRIEGTQDASKQCE